MKKTLLITAAALSIASSAFAAVPDMSGSIGQLHFSYQSFNLDASDSSIGNLGDLKANEYQANYGLNHKLGVFGNYIASDTLDSRWTNYGWLSNVNYNATEIGLRYQVTPNVALTAGNVRSEFKSVQVSDANNEIFGGIDLAARIAPNLNAYGSYLKSAGVSDVKAGVSYRLSGNASLNFGYRDYQDSNIGVSTKGTGMGVSYNF